MPTLKRRVIGSRKQSHHIHHIVAHYLTPFSGRVSYLLVPGVETQASISLPPLGRLESPNKRAHPMQEWVALLTLRTAEAHFNSATLFYNLHPSWQTASLNLTLL